MLASTRCDAAKSCDPAPSAGSGGDTHKSKDTSAADSGIGPRDVLTPPAAGSGGDANVNKLPDAAGSGGAAAAPTSPASEATWIPHSSWACGMPEGIPPPKSGTLAFQVSLQLGEIYNIGRTQFGDRLVTEIKGGTVTGDQLHATVMERGLDWQVTLPNHAVELEQVAVLRTDDGTNIFMRLCGAAPSTDSEVRIVPDIEAPNTGSYSWLNEAKLVGTRTFDPAAKTMTLAIYKIGAATNPTPTIHIERPADLPKQSWDCAKAMGERADTLYTASVGIDAASISVGASKRGNRNIVPITGGTFSGRISGTVLSGGADFQLGSLTDLQLDARYTLKTDDGELIIIRNCGTFSSAVPAYETREDGPYAFVNKSKWLATGTSVGAGVVNMIIYEAKLP